VKAATNANDGSAREQAEAAIRELRRHRNAVAERLAEVGGAPGQTWRERKKRLAAAREELERKVDEVSATLD
jgi:DNA-binding ferritin-like protein